MRTLWMTVASALALLLSATCGEVLGPPPVWETSDAAASLDGRDAGGALDLPPETEDADVPDDGGEAVDPVTPEDPGPGDPDPEDPDPGDPDPEVPEPELPDAGPTTPEPEDPLAWVPACTSQPCPNVIERFPYVRTGNTSGGASRLDAYSCAPELSEAGPEELYVFRLTEPGVIIVGLTEPSGGDVDVHLLTAPSASSCFARGDKGVSEHLGAGVYYIAMDTYKSAANAGTYSIRVTFLADSGRCALEVFDMDRVNDGGRPLPMPATGKIVKEAHLVTVADQAANSGKSWWPSTSSEYLAEHKARTATQTGISYSRTERWAPAGEGGCEYGQGSTGAALPDAAEPWYVCMYWRGAHRPAPGTRYLVVNPATGKAIVAAAGYETGPGDLSRVGGAVEEIHHLMGTVHLGTLTFGELSDQSLPYGEIDCGE